MGSKRRFVEAVVLCAILGLFTPLYAYTPWLHTEGNKIKDPNGNVVVLRGVDTIDIGATEVWYGGLIATIDRVTNKNDPSGNSPGWYTKVIRLAIYPINEDNFTGGPWYWETNHDDFYNNLLRPAVDYCKAKDIYVIIDWHYVGDNTYDRMGETTAFWSYMAPKFAGDSHVLFELFNEPMNASEGSETANWLRLRADMQIWIDIVRVSAPNNLILVGAPNWSQQVGSAALDPFTTFNPNNHNLVMVVHLYPGHWLLYGQNYFKNHVMTCLMRYPVFATEWGFWETSDELLDGTISNYGQPLMDFYEENKISHSAWCVSFTWNPPMFNPDWTLRVGETEMGGFTKDMLYAKRFSDQPGADAIAPAIPAGLSATAGDSMVVLNWNDNSEEDLAGYNVYRSVTPGSGYTLLNGLLLAGSNYTDNTANGSVTYYYVVRALDIFNNESGNSSQVSATPTDPIPPSAPTELTALAGNNTVLLNWNNNSEGDVVGYNVYRSTTSGGTYTRLNEAMLSSSNYTDNSVINDTTYYYVVTAVDTSANESANSNQVSAIPSTDIPVQTIGSWVTGTTHAKVPGNNRALVFIVHAEYSNTSVALNSVSYGEQTMTKVIDGYIASSYNRDYVAAYILNDANINAATTATFNPNWTGAPASISYASVFLQNVNQITLTGATASTTTTAATATTAALSNSNMDMVIDAATCGNVGSYTLNNGFIEGAEQTVGTNGLTGVTGSKPTTSSPETPSVTFTGTMNRQVLIGFVVNVMPNYPPAAPTGVTTAPGIGAILLDWNNNSDGDVVGYNVYRSTTSGSGYVKLNSSRLNSPYCDDVNIAVDTTYYYVVTAVDAGGLESVYSSEVSAETNYSAAFGTGAVLREWWNDIPGDAITNLLDNENYPGNPSGRRLITKLEGPINWADNYGTRIRGYLNPVASGSYSFWIASDGQSELVISTDTDPENIGWFAYVADYTDPCQWDKYPSQQVTSVPLVAGQKYYIEVRHKASEGNDNIAVAWEGPGIRQQIIDGIYLSPCYLEFTDFADFAGQWNRTDCGPGNDWCSAGDFNRDGNVELDDLAVFANSWLTGAN